MKKTFLRTAVLLCLMGGITAGMTSCKKKGCTDETATNYDPDAEKDDGSCEAPKEAAQPSNPQPTPSGADAVLIGLQTVTYTEYSGFPVETAIGLPVAVFLDGSNFKDVGEVTCEELALSKQDNNSYVYIPDADNPLGVTYSGDLDWVVEGGNGFPAMTGFASGIFPSNLQLTIENGESVDIGSEFTLSTTASISNADSVYFGVYGPEGSLLKVQPGSVSSYTFTADEMSSVGPGGGFVQVAAYRVAKSETLGTGEVVYYLNEKVNTTPVTFE